MQTKGDASSQILLIRISRPSNRHGRMDEKNWLGGQQELYTLNPSCKMILGPCLLAFFKNVASCL